MFFFGSIFDIFTEKTNFMKKTILFTCLLLILLGLKPVLAQKSLEITKKTLSREMVSEDAPDFLLKDLDGNEVKLSNLKGKVVFIDFWATWCKPCVQAMPGVKTALDKYKDDKNVVFLFIATSEQGKADVVKERLKNFITKKGYNFTVLHDTDGKTSAAYQVFGIPLKLVIDAKGELIFRKTGFDGSVENTAQEVEAMIELAKERK